MTAPPIPVRWDGEAFVPMPGYARLADRHFVIGQRYVLVEHEDRSRASHNHFFAVVASTFENLSDDQRERWPTEDTLRKYALCKAGCCDVATRVCATKAEADRLADFLTGQGYGDLVVASGCVVTVLTAWSMKQRAMNKARFQECKDKALVVLADLIGVEPSDLERQAA